MFCLYLSLMADGPQRARFTSPTYYCNFTILPVVNEDLPISARYYIIITVVVNHRDSTLPRQQQTQKTWKTSSINSQNT